MEPLAAQMFLLLMGALILIVATRAISTSLKSYNWPSTRGAILTADIDELRGQLRIHGKQLCYSYMVDDVTYTSNRVYASIPDNVLTYAFHFYDRKFIERNYEGLEEVVVYYDPQHPERSCIRQGGTKYVLQETAIWVVLLFVATYWVIGVDV